MFLHANTYRKIVTVACIKIETIFIIQLLHWQCSPEIHLEMITNHSIMKLLFLCKNTLKKWNCFILTKSETADSSQWQCNPIITLAMKTNRDRTGIVSGTVPARNNVGSVGQMWGLSLADFWHDPHSSYSLIRIVLPKKRKNCPQNF